MKRLYHLYLFLIVILLGFGCRKPDLVADISKLQGTHSMAGSEHATNTAATFVPDTTFNLSFKVKIEIIDKNTIRTSVNDSFLNANYIPEDLHYFTINYRTNEITYTAKLSAIDAYWVDTLTYNFITNQIAQHQISEGNGGKWDVSVHAN